MRFLNPLSFIFASALSATIGSDDPVHAEYAQCGFLTNANPRDQFGLRNTNENDCRRIERGTKLLEVTNYTINSGCFCEFFRGCHAAETPCSNDQQTDYLEGWLKDKFEESKTPEYFRCWAPGCIGHCPHGN